MIEISFYGISVEMVVKKVFLISLQFSIVFLYRHEKSVAKKTWPENCSRGSYVLNDCNWCHCDKNTYTYKCKARVCSEIDMFGNFNDAIQDLNVGMAGHGAWRTKETACDPGVPYRRDSLLCVCSETGSWPNPICRDTFQVMHHVEVPTKSNDCTPTKLYVVGCNVCFCPHTGQFDSKLCTHNNCSDADDIAQPLLGEEETDEQGLDIFAECTLNRKYKFGCKKCLCLRNNRLLCDNCTTVAEKNRLEDVSYCSKAKVGEVFVIDCNLCTCDERGFLYCTAKKCLKKFDRTELEVSKARDLNLRTIKRPYDDSKCIPGTKYKKNCNVCFCSGTEDGKPSVSCTLKSCEHSRDVLDEMKSDCVEGTVYESDCRICRCDVIDGVKRESCYVYSNCDDDYSGAKVSTDISSMHGYCEPLHVYKMDCNTCRCQSDGKVLMCTANICKNKGPVTVDIVPIYQTGVPQCEKDRFYRVGCNFCFCLSNGNVLCTTANCKKLNRL